MNDRSKLRKRVELETLYEILDRVDYYQLLQIERDAPQGSIDPAFRAVSRTLHPDRIARLRARLLGDPCGD